MNPVRKQNQKTAFERRAWEVWRLPRPLQGQKRGYNDKPAGMSEKDLIRTGCSVCYAK